MSEKTRTALQGSAIVAAGLVVALLITVFSSADPDAGVSSTSGSDVALKAAQTADASTASGSPTKSSTKPATPAVRATRRPTPTAAPRAAATTVEAAAPTAEARRTPKASKPTPTCWVTRREPGDPCGQLKPYTPMTKHWPQAGSGTVTLPANDAWVKVPGTAVALSDVVSGPLSSGGSAPAKVVARVYGREATDEIGGDGISFQISRVAGATQPRAVRVRLYVGGFASSAGGGFESRLVLASKPGCALRTSPGEDCQMWKDIPSSINTQTSMLTATVPIDTSETNMAEARVYAVGSHP